ncbi:hypothetical protein [Pseudofrankia sp. BMG5.36]|uniref:hypothetical protein n=1 Tax=Pseudofrankia sp. BMG5.36 TaxID=1834512 RepID=UPI0008DA62BE|nr:hypothetical protein [Pseudofrankia sp. BMG5.36]OHV64189.1 hypothetical protein BCD48_37720 [Pseudofrankia sp. BMG5.36]
MHRVGVHLTLAYYWLTALPTQLVDRITAHEQTHGAAADRDGRRPDRGDALSTAVITVGLVIIAATVVAIILAKAKDTANNICVSSDPTTCQ